MEPQRTTWSYINATPSATQWIKFSEIHIITFIGKDVICAFAGCHILLRHLLTQEEHILRANEPENGEGINCLVGHRTIPVFAYSEMCNKPRIKVMAYPELKPICTLINNDYDDYISMVFSETEYLATLSGFPKCDLTIWKWRTGENMATTATDFIYRQQSLKANFTTPTLFVQYVKYTKKMKVWDVTSCGRKVIITPHTVTIPNEHEVRQFSSLVFTTDGGCFVIDLGGNVYSLSEDFRLNKILTWETPGTHSAKICWYMGGLVVQGPSGELQFYRKDGDWLCEWSITPNYPIQKLIAATGKDCLIAKSKNEDLLMFDPDKREFCLVRSDDGQIDDMCVIYPMGQYVITIGAGIKLYCWDIETGAEESKIIVPKENRILKIASNTIYPYFAAGCADGYVRLYSCLDGKIRFMCSFFLTRNEINMIKFAEMGKMICVANMTLGEFFVIEGVPGGKFRVIGGTNINRQAVDYALAGDRQCLRLFVLPITSRTFLAGNMIIRYCILQDCPVKVKEYKLENPLRHYVRIYNCIDHKVRDRVIYAIPQDNKNMHTLEMKRGDTHARIIDRCKTQQLMKRIRYVYDGFHAITFAYDGIITVRTPDFSEILYRVMPHHRYCAGVASACINTLGQYLISLGREGLLVCTKILNVLLDAEKLQDIVRKMDDYRIMFSRPSRGFAPKGIFADMCWLEYMDMMKKDRERIFAENERKNILEQYQDIKKRVVTLLEKNLAGPENEYLDLQEFNMDPNLRDEKLRQAEELCQNTKIYLENLIADHERIAALIKTNFWDTVQLPTKNLWAIFANMEVQNYAISLPDGPMNELLLQIGAAREVETALVEGDMFKPWLIVDESEVTKQLQSAPSLQQLKSAVLDIESIDLDEDVNIDEEQLAAMKEKKAIEMETYTALAGTSIHNFITPEKSNYNQQELSTFYQHYFQYYISMYEQDKLRLYFNEQHETMFQQKLKEVSFIVEKNSRLRYILSELNYFSETKIDYQLIDPEWKQDEDPELLHKVTDDEVGVLPYISPSEQAILDAIAAEEERIRLALLADDFKERALMKMMNGVLEVRWEDELRKEVPKPKCMIEKEPENYNAEDILAVQDYEEKVRFLHSERERYKGILETEYAKGGNTIRDSVRKFNERLEELLILKLQIEAATEQEMLRINMMREYDINRSGMEKDAEDLKVAIKNSESRTEELIKLIQSLQTFLYEIKHNYDNTVNKEKYLDKAFRKDFHYLHSNAHELVLKYYKKRPKTNLKNITSYCILNETARCLVQNDTSLLLCPEALEFLRAMTHMDKYIGISPVVDETNYALMCRHRRLKIESEIRIRAHQLELSEAEATIQMFQKSLAASKENTNTLHKKLSDLREKIINTVLNIDMQVVIKEGFVELPRTGVKEDFKTAVLVTKNEILDVNKVIIETGKKKLRAMKNALQYKKEIMMQEWQHKRKKMIIVDLKQKYQDVLSVKVTKEIQQYLKDRARGASANKMLSIEHEIENTKQKYEKTIREFKEKIQHIDERMAILEAEAKKADKQIRMINVDVCEYQLDYDIDLEETERKIIYMKMQSHLKRSKLVNLIQDNHMNILVLQAELELHRMKTFPILDYKIDI